MYVYPYLGRGAPQPPSFYNASAYVCELKFRQTDRQTDGGTSSFIHLSSRRPLSCLVWQIDCRLSTPTVSQSASRVLGLRHRIRRCMSVALISYKPRIMHRSSSAWLLYGRPNRPQCGSCTSVPYGLLTQKQQKAQLSPGKMCYSLHSSGCSTDF